MLYETAARSAEVLALDVEDLDLPNRRAKDHNDQMVMMIKSAAEAAPGLRPRRGSQHRQAADEHRRGRAALEPNWAGKAAVIRRGGPSLRRGPPRPRRYGAVPAGSTQVAGPGAGAGRAG